MIITDYFNERNNNKVIGKKRMEQIRNSKNDNKIL